MKHVFYLILIYLISQQLNAQDSIQKRSGDCQYNIKIYVADDYLLCDPNPYALVFSDEFNGTNLDLTKWYPYPSGVPRDINFTSQKAWHQPENAVVNNGTLKIKVVKEQLLNKEFITDYNTTPVTTKTDNFDYSTAEIWTKYQFSYGKYEARIKIPNGQGLWPAFWTFGDSPVNDEIDIFEIFTPDPYIPVDPGDNFPKIQHMTIHHNGSECGDSYEGIDLSQDFHIYTMIYAKDKIEWYVDGNLRRREYCYYLAETGQELYCNLVHQQLTLRDNSFPFNPMSIILNVAVQTGAYRGPATNTIFPSQMEVDWVRYYEHKSCQAISITNASQITINPKVFNSIVGTTVAVNCAFQLQNTNQLNMIAQSTITLSPGFSAFSGSVMDARIDPNLCSGVYRVAANDQESEQAVSAQLVTDKQIVLYPNPTEGTFTLALRFSDKKTLLTRFIIPSDRK